LGNNYLSAVIVARNALNRFPTTRYREDLSIIVLEAKFQQALLSVEERREERYTETIDEAYSFINEFPDGRHRRQADRILRDARRVMGE
jgi:outer membrane protein assembly factor BamD